MKLGFGKPKQKDPAMAIPSESVAANRLKELCGGDSDLYGALSRLLFLDPKKITASIDQVLTDAQGFEVQGSKLRAEVGYRVAGGISLSKGDANGVKSYFGKAAMLAGDSKPEYEVLVKRSSEAVNVARKFYDEFGSLNAES